MTIRIKNWGEHQHFKDRSPPWIKVHREIINDVEWHELSGDDAKLLISLWLIASEDKELSGKLPDIKNLCFRLRIKETQLNQALIRLSHWLIQDDINVISDVYQCDMPEKSRDREKKEKEKEVENKAQAPEFILPEWIDKQHWDAWHLLPKRKNLKPEQKQLAVDQLAEWRDTGVDYALALKNSATSGWQGLFKPATMHQKNGHVNKQEALEASNRAVVERLLAKEAQYAQQ